MRGALLFIALPAGTDATGIRAISCSATSTDWLILGAAVRATAVI